VIALGFYVGMIVQYTMYIQLMNVIYANYSIQMGKQPCGKAT
jgi:hypothetical protein